MKTILLAFLLLTAGSCFSQTHSLVKKWETDTLLKTPESVLFVEKQNFLYVSNIDGTPDGADGKGSIGKVGLDGKIIQTDWVTGLNCPKGMGLYKDKLYVADLTEVVVIDVVKGAIVEHIPIEKSIFLNDITIDKKGTVYVSDTRNFKIYQIEQVGVSRKITVLAENLKGPNGLLAVGEDLMILDRGTLLKMNATGQMITISEGMDPSTDGIEMVKKDEFVVSCWSGIIYYVSAEGNKRVLHDSREQKINTADIGYDAKKRIVYVPTFYHNSVIAFELK